MLRRAVLFLPLLLLAGCHPRPGADAAPRLARLQAACDRAARIDDGLLAAPSGPDEAADALAVLARLAAEEGEWDRFRAWAAGAKTRPETLAGLDRAWGDYGAARDAFRAHLEKWAAADPKADQPGLDAKRSADYVTLHNRLAAACGALTDWAARASPSDFDLTSPASAPAAAPGPSPAPSRGP